jgi:tyrosyl-tRNA synthetase
MRFFLGPELLERVPDTVVAAVVAEGVDPTRGAEAIRALLDEAAEATKTPFSAGDPGVVAEIAAWRERLGRLGVDAGQYPASIETLIRRVAGGDVPRVGPVVDLANAISLKYRVPVGAHDLDRLRGDLGVRLAREGEYFTGLGEIGVERVPAGEPVYADDREVRTRRWVWRQGERGKVTAGTRSVFFPIDGFAGVTDEAARRAASDLAARAQEQLGARTTILWVDRSAPSAEVPHEPRQPDAIDRLLERGLAELYPSRAEVERRLRAGERLRIYIGVDPTSPVIHIGHAVGIRKLRQLQDLGHQIVLLIGDFTGRIGDPTGKDTARVPLTVEQVRENAQSYRDQVAKILDFDRPTNPVELRYNGEWFDEMQASDMIRLAANFTVQQMIQREMFQRRLAENKPISVHEFMYPMLQGYDSVALNVDAELGGTDQTFNMLAGRTLMHALQGREKLVFVTPLLEGTDGRKMSKSFGNVIGVGDPPYEMYARVMSIADALLMRYYEMCTDLDEEALDEVRHTLAGGVNPMTLKKRLARLITASYHDGAAALRAEERFEREVQRHETPTEMSTGWLERGGEWNVVDLLVAAGLAASKSEARRLVEGGAVRLDDQPVRDPRATVEVRPGAVLRAGKRAYARLELREAG